MKKVLLVGDSPIADSPYINNYIEILKRNSISFDYLFWNRHLDDTDNLPDNFLPYNHYTDIKYPFWKKIIKIRGFANFANRCMREYSYSFVVVFTIAHAVFMYATLKKYYKGRFVFDIRDYSPMCGMLPSRLIITKLIDNAALTVISSEGFLQWLPKCERFTYVVDHNTTKEKVEAAFSFKESVISPYQNKQDLKILTIGQIAYYNSQVFFIDQLANKKGVTLSFIGSGPASAPLLQYVKENVIENVEFKGRYEKMQEISLVKPFDMINIWLKHDINADSCMANRFYLSVQQRKPMIVSKNSFQGLLCEKYGLGVVLDEGDVFVDKFKEWWDTFDAAQYEKGCIEFLHGVYEDLDKFEKAIVNLFNIKDEK